jgi:hypothetical protein
MIKFFAPNTETNMATKTRKTHRKGSRKNTRKATRKTQKQGGGASAWNKKVMEVYREMKRKDPKTRLGDAMREASRRSK